MIPVLLFPQFDPVIVQIGPFGIRWYALAYIAGLVLGWRLLRYLVQQDIAAIPRTSRTGRLAENFAIFDFELSAAEMKEIAALASRSGRLVDFSYSESPRWD